MKDKVTLAEKITKKADMKKEAEKKAAKEAGEEAVNNAWIHKSAPKKKDGSDDFLTADLVKAR